MSKRSRAKSSETSSFGESEVNFLQELKLSQDRALAAKEDLSDDEEETSGKAKKDRKKKSVYNFFLEMNKLGASAPS